MRFFKKKESSSELREFTSHELQAVRSRLDRMQKELDTALELAMQQTNLANTALESVNEQNATRHKELMDYLAGRWDIIEKDLNSRTERKKAS